MGSPSATPAREPARQPKDGDRHAAAPRTPRLQRMLAHPGGTALPPSFGKIPALAPQERLPLQPKLAIGAVSDPLESEADAVAERVMRMPAPTFLGLHHGDMGVQRKCTACKKEEEDEEEEHPLARKATSGPAPATAPAIVHDVLRETGRPLDPALRAFAEPRMGYDFSRVRVHTGERAAQSADAVQALAYTVGNHVVFAHDRYQPSTSEGRRLLVHELSHTVQQGAPALRRTPGPPQPDAPGSPPSLVLAPAEDKTENNARLAAFAASLRKGLADSPSSKVLVTALWTSLPTESHTGDVIGERNQLRSSANGRAEAVKAALVKLGIPAGSISASNRDLNEDSTPSGSDGQILLTLMQPLAPALTARPMFPIPPPPPGAPLLDLDRDADLTASNLKIAETAKYNLIGPLQDPGGTVNVVAYVGQDPGNDAQLWQQQQVWAQARADSVRSALISLGVGGGDISAEVKFVPVGDPRASHVTISFTPKAAAPPADSSLGDLTTLLQITNPNFSLTIKIPLPYVPVPKSVEFKHALVEAKATIPKGISVKLKPVRGLPGVEIGFSGEITKLSSLFNPPTPATLPGGFTQPKPGTPLKFSLTAGINFKGFKIEASTELDLEKRTETTGLFFTLIESSVQYQVPSSVFDDINKAGAQIQKAVNNLMGVADQQVAQAPVGQPPPPQPTAPPPATISSAFGNLSDIIDGMSSILDAMDKIDKAKTTPAQPKLKIGPQVIVPFGPDRAPTATDPLGNQPAVIFGISGTF